MRNCCSQRNRRSLNKFFEDDKINKFVYTSFHLSRCRLDVQYKLVDYLYTPTYTRIGAYFIGVYAGWFLSSKDRKLNINKVMQNKMFIISFIHKKVKQKKKL